MHVHNVFTVEGGIVIAGIGKTCGGIGRKIAAGLVVGNPHGGIVNGVQRLDRTAGGAEINGNAFHIYRLHIFYRLFKRITLIFSAEMVSPGCQMPTETLSWFSSSRKIS